MTRGWEVYLEALLNMALHLCQESLQETQKNYFLDKTPRYYQILPELNEVFPEANYIFLLRNPLAVFSSILKTWMAPEKRYTEEPFRIYNHDLLTAPKKMLEGIEMFGQRALVIHYEGFVQDAEKWTKDLCRHIGVEYQAQIMDYGKHSQLKGKMGDTTGIHKNDRPVASYTDKWKEVFASAAGQRQARSYLSALGTEILEKIGYPIEELLSELVNDISSQPVKSTMESIKSMIDRSEALSNRGDLRALQLYCRKRCV